MHDDDQPDDDPWAEVYPNPDPPDLRAKVERRLAGWLPEICALMGIEPSDRLRREIVVLAGAYLRAQLLYERPPPGAEIESGGVLYRRKPDGALRKLPTKLAERKQGFRDVLQFWRDAGPAMHRLASLVVDDQESRLAAAAWRALTAIPELQAELEKEVERLGPPSKGDHRSAAPPGIHVFLTDADRLWSLEADIDQQKNIKDKDAWLTLLFEVVSGKKQLPTKALRAWKRRAG